jgi:putative PIN family toxin of toxin-antitoxin system
MKHCPGLSKAGIISKPIIDEVLGVLARKFRRDREALARTAVLLADLGEMVWPERRLRVLKDQPDNRILECALEGRVAAIVTGDREMLKLGSFEGVKVLSLRAFLHS